ncbi:MAG: tetratricopeptide repeat protein [Alphaproteobacteria bacterium]|nr:tetratricopeptide repeat protein [Alphaproteobacteria bacterium]
MNRAERRRLEKLGRRTSRPDLLNDAARFHRAGQLPEAEAGYRAFLKRFPGHAQALHLLGLVCHQSGRNQEAAGFIAEAERLNPGDPDAPYNLGNCLMAEGRLTEAADAFRRALVLRPRHAESLNNLGTTMQRLGRADEAVEAYRGALAAEPSRLDTLSNLAHALLTLNRRDDAIGTYRQVLAHRPDHGTARHMIAALSGETPAAAPDDYIRQLFDDYAERFDQHLTTELGYAPQRYVDVLRRAAGPARRFTACIDLGCGTGILGTSLRPIVERLVGIDLSPGMLAQAEARKVYDDLSVAGIEPYLEQTAQRFDLFFAGDVLVYLGTLDRLFAKAAARAMPGAWFGFSVETADGACGRQSCRLHPGRRQPDRRQPQRRQSQRRGPRQHRAQGCQPLRRQARGCRSFRRRPHGRGRPQPRFTAPGCEADLKRPFRVDPLRRPPRQPRQARQSRSHLHQPCGRRSLGL